MCVAIFHSQNRLRSERQVMEGISRQHSNSKANVYFRQLSHFLRDQEKWRDKGKLKGDLDCVTLVMVYEMPRKSFGLRRIEN